MLVGCDSRTQNRYRDEGLVWKVSSVLRESFTPVSISTVNIMKGFLAWNKPNMASEKESSGQLWSFWSRPSLI